MNPLFPIFDWLHAHGLLSTEGTLWDYFVVICVGNVLFTLPIFVVMWAFS